MSTQVINTIFQFKRGNAEDWLKYSNSGNPASYIPFPGEPCFEIDTGKLKIGNGKLHFDELSYTGGSGDLNTTEGLSMILNNPNNQVYEIGEEGYALAGGQNSVAGCKGYYIKAIVFDFNNTPGYHVVFLSSAEHGDSTREQVKLHNYSENESPEYWMTLYKDTTISFDNRVVNKAPGFVFSGSYIYKGAIIKSGNGNYLNIEGNLGFDKSVDLGGKDDDEGIFFVPEIQDYGKFTFTNKGFAFGEQGNSAKIAFLTVNSNTPTAAIGRSAVAFGRGTVAMNYAGAFGRNNIATNYSFVAGQRNLVSYSHSAAFGVDNRVDGYASFATGSNHVIIKSQGFAAGSSNTVNGACGTAFGTNNIINGQSAFAAGEGLVAEGARGTVVGKFNVAQNNYLFTVGCGTTKDNRNNALWVTDTGRVEVSAQGTTDNSVVIRSTIMPTFATYQLGEGNKSALIGGAEAVKGNYSFATGLKSRAEGYVSMATGYFTVAKSGYSLVTGKFNNYQNTNDLFQVGNGTAEDNRQNAFSLGLDGTAKVQTQGTEDNSVVIYKTLLDKIADLQSQIDELKGEA